MIRWAFWALGLAWLVTALCLGSGCGDNVPPTVDAGVWRGYPPDAAPEAAPELPSSGPPDCEQPGATILIFLPCPHAGDQAECRLRDPDSGTVIVPSCTTQGRRCVEQCPPFALDGGGQ